MKSEKFPIRDLQQNLFVRETLDQDHVLSLAEKIEAGVKLDPIKINQKKVVIDGRHRIEAHELNGLIEIEAEVVDVSDESELIALAYRSNDGGAKPPTQADTEHTVMLLLERGVPRKHIGEQLNLPAELARKYINLVQSKTARATLLRAAAAVTDGGLTVAKAAEQYGVDVDKLKEILSGRRKRHKQGVAEVQRNVTRLFKSVASKNAATIRSLLEKFEDGDVTEKQVREIFEHVEDLQKRSARAMADWKKRFEATLSAKKGGAQADTAAA